MLIPRIKKISVLFGSSVETHEVGYDKITEILDKSSEFEDSIDRSYFIMKGKTLYKEIVNLPVIVTHSN